MEKRFIFNSKPDKNFTIVSNEIFTRSDLSAKAKYTLLYLLSKPSHWKVQAEDVARTVKESKSTIYNAFNELIEAGYMKRVEIRENGKIKGYETYVSDIPCRFQNTEYGFSVYGICDISKN
jgi:predicted transcriptional regulator